MSDEEIALKLVDIYCKDRDGTHTKELYWDTYFYYLEKIKNYKSETLKGKIEYELKQFDINAVYGISPVDYQYFINKIRDFLGE